MDSRHTGHKRRYQFFIIVTIALIVVYVIQNEFSKDGIPQPRINPHADKVLSDTLSTDLSQEHADKVFSEILSTDLSQELVPRIVAGSEVKHRDDLYVLNTYHYDFRKTEAIHTKIAGLDTRAILKRLFSEVTSDIPEDSHTEKWFHFSDFVSRRLRHPPLTQPMYADKTMVSHPLVLLLLGEGRCGHQARVIVDVGILLMPTRTFQ